MENIIHNGESFKIPMEVVTDYKFLVDLVLVTKSMNQEEKQFWFYKIAHMSEEENDRLLEILLKEKIKLEKVEEKYQKKIKALKKKHSEQWKKYEEKLDFS
ncbi:MAG: hypothetical protein N4A38_03795 [Candidatus Gracilibacteria bacterium]|nr:hypothetical protein [Candidatus Gracilibacteria bacterium]